MPYKITDVINQNAKAFIPTKPAHQKRKTNPWMTRNILLLLRKRHRLYKRWRRSQNPVHKQLENNIRNLVQRKIQVAKNRTCQPHRQTTELALSKQRQLLENCESILATFYRSVLPSFI